MSGYQENVDLAVLIVVLYTKTKFLHHFLSFLKEKWRPSWIFLKKNQILKKQLLNIRLRDIVAKYELPKSKSEVIGAKIRFFLKNTKKW